MSYGIARCNFECIFNKKGLCTNEMHTYAEGRTEKERHTINEQRVVVQCPHKISKCIDG